MRDNVVAFGPGSQASPGAASASPPSVSIPNVELWEGIVRFMEANGRSKVEIGINDAREVATWARIVAEIHHGRKQATQAEVAPQGEGSSEMGPGVGSGAQENSGADGIDTYQARQALQSEGRARTNRLTASAIEAASADKTRSGLAEGESAGLKGDAQIPTEER